MKKLVNILLFLLLNYHVTSSQWIEIDSHVSENLFDVCFSDSLNGWSVGDNSVIIHTSDRGVTWEVQACPQSNINLKKVFFVDKNLGVIIGDKGIILRTIDGGKSWELNILDTSMTYTTVDFVDKNIGWIVGGKIKSSRSSRGIIFKTIDGGKNWTQQYQTDTTLTYSEGIFTSINFNNDKTGYAITSNGGAQLYSTSNGGNDWIKNGSFFYGMNLLQHFGDTIWIAGEGFASTVNEGRSWAYNSILGGDIQDLVMLDGSNGYLISAWLNDKKLLKTTDGGISWEDVWVYGGSTLFALHIDSLKSFVCMVGVHGRVVINNNLLTHISTNYPSNINNFKLSQNYPNPCNPETNIKFEIPEGGDYSIIIYSLLGEEVQKEQKYYSAGGIYQHKFDVSNLSSGVYFYNLIGKKGSLINKMLIQK